MILWFLDPPAYFLALGGWVMWVRCVLFDEISLFLRSVRPPTPHADRSVARKNDPFQTQAKVTHKWPTKVTHRAGLLQGEVTHPGWVTLPALMKRHSWDSATHGSMPAWMHGCMDPWIHGCADPCIGNVCELYYKHNITPIHSSAIPRPHHSSAIPRPFLKTAPSGLFQRQRELHFITSQDITLHQSPIVNHYSSPVIHHSASERPIIITQWRLFHHIWSAAPALSHPTFRTRLRLGIIGSHAPAQPRVTAVCSDNTIAKSISY